MRRLAQNSSIPESFVLLGFLVLCSVVGIHAQNAPPCGAVLNSYKGIPSYSNGIDQWKEKDCDDADKLTPFGAFGEQFQCTEYVKRFYFQALGVTEASQWTGDAIDYFDKAAQKNLTAYQNGGYFPPAPDDIITFSGPDAVGHVAIIESVSDPKATNPEVTFIEQNWSVHGTWSLPYSKSCKSNGCSFIVSDRTSRNSSGAIVATFSVTGWLRSGAVVLNPVPSISSLNPSSSQAGSTAEVLAISGTGFANSSVATFNGFVHSTTFVSSSQLTITLSETDLATVGSYPVIVTNPAPGGGASNPATFIVALVSTGGTVAITPTSVTLAEGASQTFTATVAGGGSVTWSVQEGSAGGTITTAGVYTAPQATGTFHIVATNAADSSQSATASVAVVPAGTIMTVAGNGSAGYTGDNSAATSATLSSPSGIAFDGNSNMFIADAGNDAIRRVDANTGVITTIAGTGVPGYNGDNQLGTNAQLNNPTHVVFDRTVNLYIADANNERIRKLDALDEITTVAGNGIAGFSGDNIPATSAELNFPDGVALDRDGNLFIGDAGNDRIREVAVAMGIISTVAGNGSAGYSGDGGLATVAELNFPSRPVIDAVGNIYIADFNNNRIRKVDATTGIITTIAGTGVPGYAGDGASATDAQLNGPISLVLDAAGNIYIADANNERIRAVNTGTTAITVFGVTIQPGQIETVVGSGSSGYSGDNGQATAAQINFPTGLIIDSNGNLFFADSGNNVVRKVIVQ